MEPDTSLPLVVDLDGTLVQTDTLHEQALSLVKDRPLHVLLLPAWLVNGKAHLKRQLACRAPLDVGTLPYNEMLLDWLRSEKLAGRRLVLCTAADWQTAQAIAQHLGIFDEVLASDGQVNLAAARKADQLTQRFGPQGFDYAGNSHDDLPVWQAAKRAIVVNAPSSVSEAAQKHGNVYKTLSVNSLRAGDLAKMLRVHQWLKNLLLFVPLLAAHQLTQAVAAWDTLLLAFFSFSFSASAVYVCNDLLDLSSDRLHPRKRQRPFASGAVPVAWGAVIAPLLALAGIACALQVGPYFLTWLAVYLGMTFWYSITLKRLVLLDCIALACLYTLRIVSGGAASHLPVSPWLLAVSGFVFLSLSFLKRHAELLLVMQRGERATAHGRGYTAQDSTLVQMFGIASGYASAVVLALYLQGETVRALYKQPYAILITVGVLVYWISWLWLQSHRGNMHDDPVVFAVKDKVSLMCGVIFVASLIVATTGIPW